VNVYISINIVRVFVPKYTITIYFIFKSRQENARIFLTDTNGVMSGVWIIVLSPFRCYRYVLYKMFSSPKVAVSVNHEHE